MSDPNDAFQKLNLRAASDHEYKCVADFKNILNKEYYPDDPPIPLDEQIQGWKNMPSFVEDQDFIKWNPAQSEIIAYCRIGIEHTGDNEHIAYFRIEVLPEYRCQGLGTKMLRMILPFAKEHQRTLLMVFASDHIPATRIFLEKIGGRRGQEMHFNQLKVSEFDSAIMDRWLEQSGKLVDEFELGFWDGEIPETHIVEIANMMQELVNDQPRDNLEIEDMKFTPEILRQWEKNMFARGDQRWIMYLTDRLDNRFVGLTEIIWNPNRPSLLHQGFTAVDPTFRNKGLGRWLKAEMVKKIILERPQVEFIRTGNANSNAPMLKINNEMGFKPYISNTIWQVDAEKIENYLKERE